MLDEKKVLEIFFREPMQDHYFREIVRRSGLPPNSVQKLIRSLLDEELIYRSSRSGNMIFYKASREKERFIRKKRLYNLETMLESGLIEKIEDDLSPDFIVLFGSFGSGFDTEESDIDIAISLKHKTDIPGYDGLFRNISIHIFEELDDALKDSVLNGTVLSGHIKVFSG